PSPTPPTHAGPIPDLRPASWPSSRAAKRSNPPNPETGTPHFEIADAQPLAVLPNPDDG
ncbi:hypothetical protein H7I76_10970, partial [Mycolicibacterium vaccae]|nr:hypothetical protein [Mycolicibacterium vaccae]